MEKINVKIKIKHNSLHTEHNKLHKDLYQENEKMKSQTKSRVYYWSESHRMQNRCRELEDEAKELKIKHNDLDRQYYLFVRYKAHAQKLMEKKLKERRNRLRCKAFFR